MSWTPQRMTLSPGDLHTPVSSSRFLKRQVHHGANSSSITEAILPGLDQDDCSEDVYSSDSGPSLQGSRKIRRHDKSISENIPHALPLGSPADVLVPAITVNALESTETTTARESETVQLLQPDGGIPPPPQPPIPDPTGSYSTDRPSPLITSALRYGIFLADATKPRVLPPTPIHPRAPMESTLQLVHCARLLLEDQHRSTSQCNPTEVYVLDDAGRHWLDAIQEDPSAQTRIRWLVSRLVKEFLKDPFLGPEAIFEVVVLGPVLCQADYRDLLSCFIERFDQSALLNASLLQGVIQLLQSAPSGFLTDGDLVHVLSSLRERLESTHAPDRTHVYQLVFAVSKVLEVMVRGEVKGLNRQRDHQSLLIALRNLKGVDDDEFLKFQVSYAYQMSLYLPEDETSFQAFWRYGESVAIGASAVASVFKLDPMSALAAVEHIQQVADNAIDVVEFNTDGARAFQATAEGVTQAAENAYWSQKKQPWFLALQAGYLFVQDGRLVDFNCLVCDATCRDDDNFQRGVCQILGEIALNPLWDEGSHRSAIEFLGELCKTDGGRREDVKVRKWVATILQQISSSTSSAVSSHARTYLGDLQQAYVLDIEGCRALHTPLPIPTAFPLLERALSITDIDHELACIRFRSLEECLHPVSIPLRAKATLLAPEDQSFPLMAKVHEFLESDKLVFLLLGDSGSGKSTFCRQLERELWNQHQRSDGGRIPLYINLPSIDDPHCSLIEKYLKHHHNILESIIQNIKDRQQFVLICDGYDESRLIQNLYTTNRLNRPGQWNVKMVITCRSTFLGREYQYWFYPIGDNIYHNNSFGLFEEATIVPFQERDIQDYILHFATQEPLDTPPIQRYQDYWRKLSAIPNLKDLVSNPFLLTLALRELPKLSNDLQDLARIKVTRLKLFDGFFKEWTRINIARLQRSNLSPEYRFVFKDLLDYGFAKCVKDFLKSLATAIHRHQNGRPVVFFSSKYNEPWKIEFFSREVKPTLLRSASPLKQAGIQHSFIHGSLLDYFDSLTLFDPFDSDDDDGNDDNDGDGDFWSGGGNSLGDGGDGLADDNDNSTGGNGESIGGGNQSTGNNGGSSGGNGGSSGGNGGSTSGNQDSSGGGGDSSGGSSGNSSGGNNDGSHGDKNGSNGDEDGSRQRKDGVRSNRNVNATKSRSSSSSDPFSERNLFKEPSVLQFLVERAESDPRLKKRLFSAIEQAKASSVPSMAAANAITILFKSGNLSQNTVLGGVPIPSDYISTATESTEPAQLSESNLTGGDLMKALVTLTMPPLAATVPTTALTVPISAPTAPASMPFSTKDRADALRLDLKKGDTTEIPGSHSLSSRLPLPTAFPLLTNVQEISKLENELHTLKLMRTAEYNQAVYIDPMAKLNLQDTDDNLFPLMDKVRDFLAGDSQVMLILGDSGAGKSTFNRHLEYELWQEYKAGSRIPLFVYLPAFERPEKDLIAEQLRTYKFSETQIQEMERHHQFVLICDGYDKSQLTSNLHTTNSLNRAGQRDAKLLIACRSQYLGPEYRLRFVPQAANQYNRAADYLFMEAVIAPFSKEQIEDYVERYIPLEPRTWVKRDYMDKLETIPNLMDLVKNPFLLTLCLEALPDVVQGKSDLSRIRVTRVQLYDNFVQHWLGVNKRRLQDYKLSGDKLAVFEELLEAGFEQSGFDFQQNLAAAIFVHQDGKPVVDYIHRRDKFSWKATFFSIDCKTSVLRDASLLSRAGSQYRFVHRSILEYFFACTICGPNVDQDKLDPLVFSDTSANISTISAHPLSQRNLIAEPSIIQFLAERVQLDSGFKNELLTIIEQSKTHEQAARAAANAITTLVKAGVRFNGANLRGIRVPGADISCGQFDSAQLQEADLTGVNFTKSWIRQADFSKAQMEGVQFGEMPSLKETEGVYSCTYSPDGTSLAVGLFGGRINIYDTSMWTMTCTFQGHQKPVKSIAYSPSGYQLLSGSNDNTVRLWDCESRSCIFVLDGHTEEVWAVAFSPSGKQVASAGRDKTVRLWDIQTGANLSILTGHTEWISSISFSPDGHAVVSVGGDGMIRFFDTQTGQPREVWESQSGKMMAVAYSPRGLEIAVGNDSGELLLYSTTTGKPTRSWKAHVETVECLSFSPNSQYLATCGYDRTVKVWSTVTGSVLSVFASHGSPVFQVAFSPNGLQLASCSLDWTIRLWDVSSLGTGVDVKERSDPLTSVLFSPNGHVLFSGTSSGAVRLYDGVSGESGLVIACKDNLGSCLAISPDGLRIALGGASLGKDGKVVTVWDLGTGQADIVLHGETQPVTAIAFSADGRWIATGSNHNTMRLWDARSGKLDCVLDGHTDFVRDLAFSPDSCRILSGSLDGTIRDWDLDSRECRVVVEMSGGYKPEWTISSSSNGWRVASRSYMSRCVDCWDPESGQLQQTLEHDGFIFSLAFSSCGQWVGVGLARSVWLWNFVAGTSVEGGGGGGEWSCSVRIRDIFGEVNSITWKSDTLEFGIGCDNGSLQVWRLVETSSPSNTWSTQLVWSAGNLILAASDAVFTDAVGLSPANQQLLTQCGKDAADSYVFM